MSKRIPLRPSLLKRRRETVKWIIIHHTSEIYDNPEARIDNEKFQMPGLYKGVLEKKHIDVNYHFVVEKIKSDYNVIMARPFVYLCDWEDIPDEIAITQRDILINNFQTLAHAVDNEGGFVNSKKDLLKHYYFNMQGTKPVLLSHDDDIFSSRNLTTSFNSIFPFPIGRPSLAGVESERWINFIRSL